MPNRSNKYHTCVDYCKEKWGMKEFQKDSDMIRKRDRMLGKYPLPDGWLEVADPETNRYYYWNLVTRSGVMAVTHTSFCTNHLIQLTKYKAIFGDSAIVSSHEDDFHLSDDEEMDVNDSESSPSSSSSSDSDSDEEFERKRQRTDTNRQDDKRGGRGGGGRW
ncbi:NPW38 [Mytilus edulis]|uniref:PQBP1 n=1 Tax=Mytilus edulis TaxID=6550 RepID=A0A8S3UAG8_MYTED|nr:NPW38 [Mytilus edulis]